MCPCGGDTASSFPSSRQLTRGARCKNRREALFSIRAQPSQFTAQPRPSNIHSNLDIENQLPLPPPPTHLAPAMARGNQRDKAREATQKKLAAQVSPHRVPSSQPNLPNAFDGLIS